MGCDFDGNGGSAKLSGVNPLRPARGHARCQGCVRTSCEGGEESSIKLTVTFSDRLCFVFEQPVLYVLISFSLYMSSEWTTGVPCWCTPLYLRTWQLGWWAPAGS